MSEKLQVQDYLNIGEGDRKFETHRRHLLRRASNEQLLALKLEIVETLGILELHSRADNVVSAWYRQKLAGLLTMVDDMVISNRKRKNGWK